MTYAEKMAILANVKPEFKDMILWRILKGERHVDITQDEDMFYRVNKDRVTLEKFVNRDRFKEDAKQIKEARKYMYDPILGKTKGKKMRWLGDIPAEIYFNRKELSDPSVPKEERQRNIRKFFKDFPAFRAADKI